MQQRAQIHFLMSVTKEVVGGWSRYDRIAITVIFFDDQNINNDDHIYFILPYYGVNLHRNNVKNG
jgi:hypothetical protein